MEAAFAVLLVIIIMCICLTTVHHMGEEAKKYRRWYDDESMTNMRLNLEVARLRQENATLNSAFYDVQRRVAKTPIKDDDIVYAVKYAMKKAHPDNGGKQEDFIKFNNLYNKIRN